MIRIIMNGCNGHMGQVITELVREDAGAEIVAGIDLLNNRENGYPVFEKPEDCRAEADVMIDFSSFRAVDGILDYCRSRKLPLVLCTTGLTEEQLQKVEVCSREFAVSVPPICLWASIF